MREVTTMQLQTRNAICMNEKRFGLNSIFCVIEEKSYIES
jgi:hypothetical protein